MEDRKLTVNLNGNDVDIEVIDMIENKDNGKKYIIYSAAGYDDDFFISILEEDETSFTLKEITDEAEFKMVEDYLASVMAEEGNENGDI